MTSGRTSAMKRLYRVLVREIDAIAISDYEFAALALQPAYAGGPNHATVSSNINAPSLQREVKLSQDSSPS